ncbi:uncharacterized protein TRUGW13939_11743 [Talaromyces rugulosus]|uniref:Uncharacterized protein n=1 Tax=Talaromyces rugulosus TaxID=121627 RepID=A0A7H8REW1_TALRU|nr:uncharacterized protein TRUGW13939_11743 [Talaromyces rugulosus]QKX64568.1 hypothetical protein TRUGW13939_11743 [Talaromyces rugulosus]
MQPTYHLPPNFSTPPPPTGPYHLGTIIRDVEHKKQMCPLNSGKDMYGKDKRIRIDTDIHRDHKDGVELTGSQLKSGAVGFWSKFMGCGINGEASMTANRSETDTYKFNSLDTEFFFPTKSYISQCMELSDVQEYLEVTEYKKPVYLVTGIKVAKGVSVRQESAIKVEGKLGLGLNIPVGSNIQVGPRTEAKVENKSVSAFGDSSDIVVGIQCLKIRYKHSWFGKSQWRVEEAHTRGATFLSSDNSKPLTEELDNFTLEGEVEKYLYHQPTEEGKEEEIWKLPAE